MSLALARWTVTRSLAARTREAARERPFLVEALAAGVVNYAAAAEVLAADVGGDPSQDALATALGRFADDLERGTRDCGARVSMDSGVGLVDDPDDALLAVGDYGIAPGEGDLTALVASGDLDAAALGAALSRLATVGIDPVAAAVADGSLVVAVERRDGADALRVVEGALETVPVVEEG